MDVKRRFAHDSGKYFKNSRISPIFQITFFISTCRVRQLSENTGRCVHPAEWKGHLMGNGKNETLGVDSDRRLKLNFRDANDVEMLVDRELDGTLNLTNLTE